MARGVLERILDRVAERMGRGHVWDDPPRHDLLGRPDTTGRRLFTASEEDFSDAWGRAALRDDDADGRVPFFRGGGLD